MPRESFMDNNDIPRSGSIDIMGDQFYQREDSHSVNSQEQLEGMQNDYQMGDNQSNGSYQQNSQGNQIIEQQQMYDNNTAAFNYEEKDLNAYQYQEPLAMEPLPKVEMFDMETQTEDIVQQGNEIAIQTEPPVTRVGITQTASVKTVEEDCQTEEVKTYSKDIQADLRAEVTQTGTECQSDFMENIEKEIT